MSGSMDDRRKALEEDYFRRKEQEALQKLREKMQSETPETSETATPATAAALGCPKCDGTLVEVQFENVQIDRCDKCGGVWLDSGELETLTTHEQGGWFSRMRQNLAGEPKS